MYLPMTNAQFRALLDLRVCNDPWPDGVDDYEKSIIETMLNFNSTELGFKDWVEAYHKFHPEEASDVPRARRCEFKDALECFLGDDKTTYSRIPFGKIMDYGKYLAKRLLKLEGESRQIKARQKKPGRKC